MALKKIEIPPHSPLYPARLSSEIVYAVQAIQAGKADAHQQSLFFHWLITEATKCHDHEYRPGGEEGNRDSALASGKRFVGLSILRAFNMTPEKVAAMRETEESQRGVSEDPQQQ